MKREEKNQQTRRRIMNSALAEFSQKGYGASSVNTICAAEGISKGIVYHYFCTKDELYLSCVEECFKLLTEYLKACPDREDGTMEERMNGYFAARVAFFRNNPVYQRIFCEAVVSPPEHLRGEVGRRRRDFDSLNVEILERLLSPVALRPGITMPEVVETFRQFQDFVNAKYQVMGMGTLEFEERDESCRKALNILLYGVIDRKVEENV